MYTIAKKLFHTLFGKDFLLKNEEFFRSIYALGFSGNKHQCTICDKKLSRFIILPHNNDKLCPKCGSLARDRRLWKLENENYIKDGMTMLDFSPSRSLARKLKKQKNIRYISTDLSGNFIADEQYDITDINLPSESIDLLACYHVLEHIDNDAKAMSELYRVLKKGGIAIVQTPFKEGNIYEDFSITSPEEREKHFGQDDHVRIYSVEGLKDRLENTGFATEIITFREDIYYGLSDNETIFILRKN